MRDRRPRGRRLLRLDGWDEEHVSGRVGAVGEQPDDNAPRSRAVRQVQDVAELRLMHRMRRAIPLHELRAVEVAYFALPDVPGDASHVFHLGTPRVTRREGFFVLLRVRVIARAAVESGLAVGFG